MVFSIRGITLKLKVKLSISDEAFYEVMLNSVKEDIFIHTGQTVKPHVGFEYKRKLPRMISGNEINTTYSIVELEENKKYRFNVITPLETTVIGYEITRLEENKIQVDYFEDTESTQARVVFSNKFFRFVLSLLFGKRRMKKKLRQIEAYVKQKQLAENAPK